MRLPVSTIGRVHRCVAHDRFEHPDLRKSHERIVALCEVDVVRPRGCRGLTWWTCHRRGRRRHPGDALTTYDRNDISGGTDRRERQRRNEGGEPGRVGEKRTAPWQPSCRLVRRLTRAPVLRPLGRRRRLRIDAPRRRVRRFADVAPVDLNDSTSSTSLTYRIGPVLSDPARRRRLHAKSDLT